jgi:ATP-binding cassette subfamily B multidrug efflux pump
MGALSISLAALEVMLYAWVGHLVDALGQHAPEAFFAAEGGRLALMAAVVLLVMPALNLVWSLCTHQTLLGNYPMRIRWSVHRYLLKQSMRYFQDEFARRW